MFFDRHTTDSRLEVSAKREFQNQVNPGSSPLFSSKDIQEAEEIYGCNPSARHER